MTKKLVSFDDQAEPGEGLPAAVKAELSATYGTKAELAGKVDAPADVADGQVPTWDAATSAWVAGDGGAADAVTSLQIRQFFASTNPNEPVPEGGFLFVYQPPFSVFRPMTSATGLTARWKPHTWSIVDDATATDGKAMQITGGPGRRMMSVDAVDADPARADAELVARIKVSNLQQSFSGGLAIRASGAEGSETGWIAGVHTQKVWLAYMGAGTYTPVKSVDFPHTANGWYWLRLRAQGTTLRVKAWADGTPEPALWQLEHITSTGNVAGWVGMYAGAGFTHTWDCLGVALDGGTAPKVAP